MVDQSVIDYDELEGQDLDFINEDVLEFYDPQAMKKSYYKFLVTLIERVLAK